MTARLISAAFRWKLRGGRYREERTLPRMFLPGVATMRFSRAFRVSVLCILPLMGAACRGGGATAGTSPTSATFIAPPATSPAPTGRATSTTPAPSPTAAASSVAAIGPVWPIEPRTIAAASTRGGPVLKAIRTARHGSYERLILEFTASYGAAKVHYVPAVRADPSDRVVPLQGSSFLEVVVHGAVAHWQATSITPYAGPSTVSPRFPTLKQVAISGDFEAVLSFGIGLGRTAGFRVAQLRSPDRLVVDVAESPAWRMWPDDSLAAARVVQKAFDRGHQPWRGSAESVAEAYARAVYGWASPVVTPVPGTDTYRLAHQGSSDHVTVRTVRPFPTTSRNSIVEIADTR